MRRLVIAMLAAICCSSLVAARATAGNEVEAELAQAPLHHVAPG